ncbi:MAG TPA: 3-hydroxybutyryl-CoA dehydrogenase [Baekduia sp.]|uniref:3-hydroxyacyl-CoA dehydrogenase family protein n=1 Tax=Baekduia sp. TaxID=2600305 RepID=UPI002B528BD3|nr:3-hydroxybutyryl-CoA dehydrogenase [Baekduia sp.]HMJ34594.1 3-hydroxybutyryl-CoA dehydrogenase [Baekduia sp.]
MSEPGDIGVIGAGFMGSGIAESAARAGARVRLHEPEQAALDRSRARLSTSLDRAVARGKMDREAAQALTDRISFHTDVEALKDSEIVIEAVFEDPEVKGSIFRALDELLPASSIIASNTSSIPIAQLASWTEHPERVVGLHFFSPVPVMDLVEVVVGLDSSDETVGKAEAFVQAIGKTPIRTKDRSGFIVNMLLVPYLMAAVRMYEDGFASREDIDQGMKLGAGHPMGPLTLCDFIGLDVLYAVCDSLYEEFKRPEYAPPPLLKRMVVSGHHGRKTGRGFYAYAG